MAATFETTFDVLKVDPKLGLVFAWGMVCSKAHRPYLDTDEEAVTPAEMLKAVTAFAQNARRPMDENHEGEEVGTVLHEFPMTDEIAKVFGISFSDRPDQVTEGWMVAVKPIAAVFAKFEDGTYTGFSIGGGVKGYKRLEAAA